MFASMFNSMFNTSENKIEILKNELPSNITKQDVENMLTELDELHVSSGIDSSHLMSKDNVIKAMDLLSLNDICPEYVNHDSSINNFDETKSEVSSVGENKQNSTEVEDPDMKKTINKINSLQCLFTWKFKPKNKYNFISWIQNKYGIYNLDISLPEFTFERYIGNLIISHELFHKGKTDVAQLKVLEIGKWLEELDNGTDEFYLSISSGLKHVMKATFIHMLFITNLVEEAKWLINDIAPFASMDPKSRATVHAVRAAVLTEYGGDAKYLKKACECAKKSCELDPNNSHWFYLNSLALTAQRQFLQSYKSSPSDNEKDAIRQAILLSNGKNAFFKYHEMILNRDTIFGNFHNNKNKNDKFMIAKNLEENKNIVSTIKYIINLEPKDPHLVVKCAKTLMTLPNMVRDFNLEKQYLIKAVNMAPNDVTVLKAIENAVKSLKESKITKTIGKELGFIVKKYKNGEDPIPYLNDLVDKFNGLDRTKIMAQICSYTILFTNDLKTGVKHFMKLIEQPGVVDSDLITNHFSLFGSKKFNLAELVFNEIRLATNSSSVSTENMLYYFKILNTIMETCKFKVKDVDSSMKDKLIVNSSVKYTCSNTNNLSETDSLDDESVIDKNEHLKQKTKNRKPKHLQNTGPKIFTNNPELNKGSKKRNDYPKKNLPSKIDVLRNKTNKKASDGNEQMKFKMSKFFHSSHVEGLKLPNNSNLLTAENLRSIQTQSEIENYTQQLYQKILSKSPQPCNLHNVSSDGLNRYFNQNHENFNSFIPQSRSQNPNLPPLLSLRPQINQQNLKPSKQQSKKLPLKKK